MLGYAWAEDKEHCEEYGRMLQADPSKVSARAKKRGLPQVRYDLGPLRAGIQFWLSGILTYSRRMKQLSTNSKDILLLLLLLLLLSSLYYILVLQTALNYKHVQYKS